MADAFKYRIDHHGSLVRPTELLDARARNASGEVSDGELRDLEDGCIAEAARQQRNLNLSVVTDGHFRRSDPFSVAVDALDGLELRDTHRGQRWIATTRALSACRSLAVDVVESLKAVTRTPAKVNLPAPSAMSGHLWDDDASSAAWGSAPALGEALAAIMHEEIQQLLAAGVRLIQIDNHRLAGWLSPGASRPPRLSLDEAIAVDTAAVSGHDKPQGAAIGICPAIELGAEIDNRAAEKLFSSVPVDRWVIPYHTGSSAEFELLKAIPAERDACLGVLDATNAGLEDTDTALARLDAAAALRNEDDMALSPNRGFADAATQPLVSAVDQWRKLVHVETLARMFWGNEL